MGKAENICKAIRESQELQNLIREIAWAGKQSCFNEGNSNSKEIEELYQKLSQSKVELQATSQSLEKYKSLYLNSKKNIEMLSRDVESYKLEVNRKDAEIKELKNKISSLESEKNSLIAEIGLEKEHTRQLKQLFENPIGYYELYKELSDSVKIGLENVINSENELSFIVSCSSDESLSAIWEYIKEISQDTESKDFKGLILIFDYFFDVFNQSLPEVKYQRDDVEVGEEFDNDYYDRCYGSSTSGDITEVILRGYKLKNTGKIIHKSLVKV